ncbi:MAG TPA: aldo/keto reductase [Candidatus Binatia bacterium]|nr:aldo/keto reductase [Candidatus Binatia bacterium]
MSGANATPASAAGTISLGGELRVNRMGFGAMRLTGPGIWGPPRDEPEARRVLRRAIELGVDFIDTADSYGPEVSERLIGETLRPYPEGLVIATKGGLRRTGPGQWPSDGRPEHLRAALEGTLQRLGVERVDLYQFHRPDPRVPFEESVGTIVNLQREGKVRLVGLSNVSVSQLRTALGMTEIASVQNRFNLMDRHSDDVLDLCEQQGIAFLPWAPLGQSDPARLGGPLGELATAHGVTPGQVALAWLLARSPQMLVIPGTSSVAHLEENVAAAGLALESEELRRLDAA